jgi:DNA repair protein RAD5
MHSDIKGIPTKNRFNINVAEKWVPSAKIKWIIQNLHRTEKSIIFSQWTSMLDLVEHALKLEGILIGRIDGSMSLGKRALALS